MKQVQAKYKLTFNRRNKTLEKGDTCPIELEVYFNRNERKFITTKISIREDQWGTTGRYKGMVKSNHPNYIAYNQYLQNMVASLQQFEYSLINKGRRFTKAILEDYLNEKYTAIDFISFMEDEAAKDKSVTAGTLKEWRYSIHMFSEFCGVNGCEFSHLNYSKLNDYDNYLRGRGLKQNTIHKHHKNLRRFINLAIKKKYLKADENPFKEFSSRQVTGTRTNITIEELARIEELDFRAPEFEQIRVVRDMFVFSAYTGMRYSDVVKLSSSEVESSSEGLTIRFIQSKVEKTRPIEVVLPLYLMFRGKPQKVLNEYYDPHKKNLFPNIANQVVNRHLKVIALAAKVGSSLTFHVARHTFGTMLADITGNPYLIMQLMGHSEIKTSMVYIHQSEERLRKQLRNINW